MTGHLEDERIDALDDASTLLGVLGFLGFCVLLFGAVVVGYAL